MNTSVDYRLIIRSAMQFAVFAGICILFSGCAGPLAVTYKAQSKVSATQGFSPERGGTGVSVVIKDIADARDGAHRAENPRLIGHIKTTISDMTGADLVIDTDISALVTKAFKDEFAASGYTVMDKGVDAKGDFELSGKVTAFALDIGARDEIEITVEGTVIETDTGRVIWSGVKTEKAGRYAGVMGNSRQTLAGYISASLAKVVRGVIDETAPMIENTKAAYRHIETQQAPIQGSGRLVVRSTPSRAKVYLNDVYYGLTPLNVDIEPGIYELKVKSKSYKDVEDKVSVRAGQLTESEIEMDAIAAPQ